MSDFPQKLTALCAAELTAGYKDPDRITEMMEQLTNSLAFTIAVFCGGGEALMSEIAEGCASYLFEGACDHAKSGKFLKENMAMFHFRYPDARS